MAAGRGKRVAATGGAVLRDGRDCAVTLLELLFSLTIVAVLALLLTASVSKARTSVRLTQCVASLRQIQLGMASYQVEYNTFPVFDEPQTLRAVLEPWVGKSTKSFNCPEDLISTNDSYSYFYSQRPPSSEAGDYVLGCTRHRKSTQGVALFTGDYAQQSPAAPIWHDSVRTAAGVEFTQGTLQFADGSQVAIVNGSAVSALYSQRVASGSFYTVVKMQDASSAVFNVTAGGRFEVVTPSAIVSVKGTQFVVTTLQVGSVPATRVVVVLGSVDLKSLPLGQLLNLTGTLGQNIGLALRGNTPILQ